MNKLNSPEQFKQGYMLRMLSEYLNEKLGSGICKRMTTEMDRTELQLTTKNMGQGLNMMVMNYDADIHFESFPFNKFDPATLYAIIGAWLMDNDNRDEYDLADPDVQVAIEDESNAELLITIEFREPIMVVEDPDGLIELGGKSYKIAPYEIWVAENFEMEVIKK
ncbi:phage tail protein [Vibrio algicola]|uniref:Phage tail protein n=1 Tax=Vibrio algicola TaxID=2662262 RepID=A0A5Q0TIN1_9VIBR|nr:phage tail protein [Vibrio algicola]